MSSDATTNVFVLSEACSPGLVNFCAGLLEVPHRQSPDYWSFIVIFIYFMQLDIINFAFTT